MQVGKISQKQRQKIYSKRDRTLSRSAPPSQGLVTWRPIEVFTYCPGDGNNQLWKNMWHWSDWKKEILNWAPASKISRFKSGICGISTDGKLLVFLNDNGTTRSSPLTITNLPNIMIMVSELLVVSKKSMYGA